MSETSRCNASETRSPVAANRLISAAYVLGRDESSDSRSGSTVAIRAWSLPPGGIEQGGKWSGDARVVAQPTWLGQPILWLLLCGYASAFDRRRSLQNCAGDILCR